MKTDRIAVFGGSFDPPHFGHLRVAEIAFEKLRLDEVLWIPNFISPHKTDDVVQDAVYRLAMTRLAIVDRPKFSVSDLEVARGGVSFTIDTLRTISRDRPDAELFLLVGEDSYEEFHTWREPEAVRRHTRLVVYPRRVSTRERSLFQPEDLFLTGNLIDISSSEIRSRISRGEPVQGLLPDAVIDYIHAKRLYTDA